MRGIFGPKRDEVTGSGENYIMKNLIICTARPILWGDNIEKNELGGACSAYGERKGVYSVMAKKPEGKRKLAKPRPRWKDNNKMDL